MSDNKTAEEKFEECLLDAVQRRDRHVLGSRESALKQFYLAGHAEATKESEEMIKFLRSRHQQISHTVYENRLASQETLIAELRSQLEEAKKLIGEHVHIFRHYGDIHAAKPDFEKANKNYAHAERARNYLAKHFGEGKG